MNSDALKRPLMLIFMGVAGSGKTRVAKLFAKKTGAIFYEGDDFHSPENIDKMRTGIPLTDADREKWLKKLRKIVFKALREKSFSVLTCSALKAKYRKILAANDPRVQFVHLTGPPSLIKERLKSRRNHFMSSKLLESQLAILETPTNALVFSCKKSPKQIVMELLHILEIVGSA